MHEVDCSTACMFLCYHCTLEWFHSMTSFCILNEIGKGISGSAMAEAWTIHRTLTIVRLLWSTCDCAERSCESILKSRLWLQTKLNSTQFNLYHYHLKHYCELFLFCQFTSFIFLLFSIVFLGVWKMGSPWTWSIFWWTRSMDRVHGGGPCFVLSYFFALALLFSRAQISRIMFA